MFVTGYSVHILALGSCDEHTDLTADHADRGSHQRHQLRGLPVNSPLAGTTRWPSRLLSNVGRGMHLCADHQGDIVASPQSSATYRELITTGTYGLVSRYGEANNEKESVWGGGPQKRTLVS